MLRLIFSLSVAAWFGMVVCVSFLVAPAAHSNFPDDARRFLRPIFPRYYRGGVVLGFVALGAVLLGRQGLPQEELVRLTVPVAVAMAASLIAGELLLPRLRSGNSDDPGYIRLHSISTMLNTTTLAALALALAGAVLR